MRHLTFTATVRLTLVLAVAVAAVANRATPIPIASADETTTVSEADMTFFYKNPSPGRIPALILYLDTLMQSNNASAQPAAIGFLAAAFQRYQGDIDKMIPDGLSTTMQRIVATSLRLAGQDAKARSMANHLGDGGAAAPDWTRVPSSLDAVTVTGPSEFDLMWGASFATGDPRYCSRILDRFASIANVAGNAEDMARIARSYGTGADLHWVVEKRGPDKARELISQSSALWALDSNARQHEFVRNAVGQYINAHPEEPASKALLALAQAYGHYDIKKVVSFSETSPGNSAVTFNVAYLTQILDDLERHAGAYPPHFEFAEDRQRAERDVSAISGLLDPIARRSPPLQLRLGILYAIGHNLDIPGAGEKAITAFTTLLELSPEDPQANYRYGAFLAATTRNGSGIPFLEKAKALGVVNADYWLGWSYEIVGDKAKALENLESYTKRVPSDLTAARVLDAIRNDKVKFKEAKPTP
jgi:tetratricopeptide (TPR) repeat protein